MIHIKAVIFDLDNTLIDRRMAFLRFCEYLFQQYAPQYPYHGTKEELLQYMIEIDGDGYGGVPNFVPRLKGRWNLPHTPESFEAERNRVFGDFTQPMPKLHEVLEELKKKYKLGIITNGFSKVQRRKISLVGIEDYFETIIISQEEKMEKPDARIFLAACEQLGISPPEAVYVGDYYPNDIAGAMSAHLIPIWITDNREEHPEYSGIRIKELQEILQIM